MNNLDKQYTDLLQDILDNGVRKMDRTGTGTISVFGRQIRHKMSEGFPLLTTKKMAFKTMVTELLWFLRGDTNIKFLVDNGCHIWDGDAYKNYVKAAEIEFNTIDFGVMSKEEFINKIKTDEQFARKWGELGPVYGKQWRNWGGKKEKYQQQRSYGGSFGGPTHVEYGELVEYNVPGIDQIQNLINNLKTNPDSRRLMVNVWNVGELDLMTLPPCHYGFQVYTRELSLEERENLMDKIYGLTKETRIVPWNILDINKANIPTRAISLMWNQRSVDTFLGLPFNIASYGLLLEIIAKLVNMVPDELIGNLGDTHLYLNHIEQAKEQIGREPYPLPTLNINTEWWPTESGEGGIGPISTDGFLQGLDNNIQHFIRCLIDDDLQLVNYQSHPPIKAPLSN
jgi:thymidylate synthase